MGFIDDILSWHVDGCLGYLKDALSNRSVLSLPDIYQILQINHDRFHQDTIKTPSDPSCQENRHSIGILCVIVCETSSTNSWWSSSPSSPTTTWPVGTDMTGKTRPRPGRCTPPPTEMACGCSDFRQDRHNYHSWIILNHGWSVVGTWLHFWLIILLYD